jgi:hypothetical protein
MKPSDIRYPHFDDHSDATGSEPEGGNLSHEALPPLRTTRRHGISQLQRMAWSMANWGYHVPDGRAYRAEAIELYREDMEERIALLFAELDAQNRLIDTVLPKAA